MDQELQVVEGEFLHILSKLLLLIHALNEEQSLGAHLRVKRAWQQSCTALKQAQPEAQERQQ